MNRREEQANSFCQLLDIIDELRIKCPWDAKQTNESLRPNTIEEVYELSEAILEGNREMIAKELGDVLLHICFYARIGQEEGAFDMGKVCNLLREKLIFRHPHVFGTVNVAGATEVEQNWEALKLKEHDGNKSILAGVPKSLPALIKAERIQEKARNAGFDWEERSQVWDKVQEELNELRSEIEAIDADKMEGELGDLLFSVINAARLYNIDPDTALERTNKKFIHRFNYLEAKSKELNKPMKEMSLEEMEAIWQEAKQT